MALRLPFFVTILLCSTIVASVALDPYESDEEIYRADKQNAEAQTEYPNGVNVIPGEAELDYPVFHLIPKTAFTCEGRLPGFYADVEARCQAWHTCDVDGRMQTFLCPNGTIYSQSKRVCEWWYNVNCDAAEVNRNYEQNKELFISPKDHAVEIAAANQDIPKQNNNQASNSRFQQPAEKPRQQQNNYSPSPSQQQNYSPQPSNPPQQRQQDQGFSSTPAQQQNYSPAPPQQKQQQQNYNQPQQKQQQQNYNQPQQRQQQQQNYTPQPPQQRPQQNYSPAPQQNFSPSPPQPKPQQNFSPSPQKPQQQLQNYSPAPPQRSTQQQNYSPAPQQRPQQPQNYSPQPSQRPQQQNYSPNPPQQQQTFNQPRQPQQAQVRPSQVPSNLQEVVQAATGAVAPSGPNRFQQQPRRNPENSQNFNRPSTPKQNDFQTNAPVRPTENYNDNQNYNQPRQESREEQDYQPPQNNGQYRPTSQSRTQAPQQRPSEQSRTTPQQYSPKPNYDAQPERQNQRPVQTNNVQEQPRQKPAPSQQQQAFPPSPPQHKFRHSTPRKHNVQFAPARQQYFDDGKERQIPSESQQQGFPYSQAYNRNYDRKLFQSRQPVTTPAPVVPTPKFVEPIPEVPTARRVPQKSIAEPPVYYDSEEASKVPVYGPSVEEKLITRQPTPRRETTFRPNPAAATRIVVKPRLENKQQPYETRPTRREDINRDVAYPAPLESSEEDEAYLESQYFPSRTYGTKQH